MTTYSHIQLQQIAQTIYPNSTLLESTPLTGGISAQTILLHILSSDQTSQKVVLRQHGEVDRLQNPNIAQDEFRLLGILHQSGLPVPKPIHIDTSNAILETPYIILDYIKQDGSMSEVIPYLELAITLIKIHQVDIHQLTFLPNQLDLLEARLSQKPDDKTRHIHATLSNLLPQISFNQKVLLHGDYWLGNLLWRDRKIIGVIDWEDAMLGDPLSDLGKCRLESLWAFGMHGMNTISAAYLAQMPDINQTYLPFWDLWGALRLADFENWFDDKEKVRSMQEQYEWFINDAIWRLNHPSG